MLKIERVGDIKNALGEGPLWDAESSRLYWVDSLKARIYWLSADGQIEYRELPAMIGSLAIVDNNTAIVALQTGLHFFDFASSDLTAIVDPESGSSETRFNDGKTDRAGNFVVGSMGIKIRNRALGCLYRIIAL